MLKPVVSSLEEVPEAFRTEYKPAADGRFVLDTNVEDHPSLTALKNTLTNVREERNRFRDAASRFDGIDPERYQILLEQERKVKEGELIAAGKLDELVALRTSSLREDLSRQLDTAKTSAAKLQADMDRLVIDNAVHAAAAKLGVKKSAIDDVLARARGTFKAQDGQAVAFKGDNPVYSKDGQSYMGIEEWLGGLPSAAPHLFEESRGGGAQGSGSSKKSGVPGPNTVVHGDQQAFLANLDKIAKGQVKVVMP